MDAQLKSNEPAAQDKIDSVDEYVKPVVEDKEPVVEVKKPVVDKREKVMTSDGEIYGKVLEFRGGKTILL